MKNEVQEPTSTFVLNDEARPALGRFWRVAFTTVYLFIFTTLLFICLFLLLYCLFVCLYNHIVYLSKNKPHVVFLLTAIFAKFTMTTTTSVTCKVHDECPSFYDWNSFIWFSGFFQIDLLHYFFVYAAWESEKALNQKQAMQFGRSMGRLIKITQEILVRKAKAESQKCPKGSLSFQQISIY